MPKLQFPVPKLNRYKAVINFKLKWETALWNRSQVFRLMSFICTKFVWSDWTFLDSILVRPSFGLLTLALAKTRDDFQSNSACAPFENVKRLPAPVKYLEGVSTAFSTEHLQGLSGKFEFCEHIDGHHPVGVRKFAVICLRVGDGLNIAMWGRYLCVGFPVHPLVIYLLFQVIEWIY